MTRRKATFWLAWSWFFFAYNLIVVLVSVLTNGDETLRILNLLCCLACLACIPHWARSRRELEDES